MQWLLIAIILIGAPLYMLGGHADWVVAVLFVFALAAAVTKLQRAGRR